MRDVKGRQEVEMIDLIVHGHAQNPAHIVRACDQGKYTRSYDGIEAAGYSSRKSQGRPV